MSYTISEQTRDVLEYLERLASERLSEYNGVNAEAAGDSSAAANRIDSAFPPADQLSPGSVGGLPYIEGIVR